jgi:hypothetical protein
MYPSYSLRFSSHYVGCRPGDVKDFVKKIKQEDARITFKKQKQEKMAKARAAAAMASVNPPIIIVSSDSTQAETPTVRTEASSTTARPTAVAVSPLHPSLPPKPGTPSKVVAAQDNLKPTIPASNSAASLTTTAAPPRVSTPVPPPVPPVDPEIAKYEEVIPLFDDDCKDSICSLVEQTTVGLVGTSSSPRPISTTFWENRDRGHTGACARN